MGQSDGAPTHDRGVVVLWLASSRRFGGILCCALIGMRVDMLRTPDADS